MKVKIPITISLSPTEIKVLEAAGITLEWETKKQKKSKLQPYWLERATFCKLCGTTTTEVFKMEDFGGGHLQGVLYKEIDQDTDLPVKRRSTEVTRCSSCRKTLKEIYKDDVDGLVDHILVYLRHNYSYRNRT